MTQAAGSKSGPECELVMCEDKDGNIIARPRGKCPDGYIEKIAAKVERDGLTFRTPKVRVESE